MKWFGNYFLELLRGPWPEIWFIRHGHGIHQTGYDMVKMGLANSPREALGMDIPNYLIPLSPLGRWQASTTREAIIDKIKPDVVYTSQIRRAMETAEIIFPGYPLRIDPRLNEKDFGPAHLRSDNEVAELFPEHVARYRLDGKYFTSRAPGGENYVDLFLKLHSILSTLRRDWAGKKVVVVCHSAVMLSIRQLFERFSPEELLRVSKEEWIDNCGILHYSYPTPFWGWRNGKFRLKLQRPPYRYWELNEELNKVFWNETQKEIKILQTSNQFPIIKRSY